MAGDLGKGVGKVQGIGANAASPKHSGTPKTGFIEPPASKRVSGGPGEGIKGSNHKIR